MTLLPPTTQLLYIDAGNTRVKCAYFEDGWEVIATLSYDELDQLSNLLTNSKKVHLVISSVSDAFDTWFQTLAWPKTTILTTADIPTERLDYETPHTLGLDRWLSCAGAYALSQQTVAVCSAGSALTIDLMDHYGVFRGGIILPGLDIIEKAAQLSAPRLPLAYLLNPVTIPARSTDDCIDAGARWMLASTLQQVLKSYEAQYGLLRVWACGGRAADVVELMQAGINAQDEDLLYVRKSLSTLSDQRDPVTLGKTSLYKDVRLDEFLVFRGMEQLYAIKQGETNAP